MPAPRDSSKALGSHTRKLQISMKIRLPELVVWSDVSLRPFLEEHFMLVLQPSILHLRGLIPEWQQLFAVQILKRGNLTRSWSILWLDWMGRVVHWRSQKMGTRHLLWSELRGQEEIHTRGWKKLKSLCTNCRIPCVFGRALLLVRNWRWASSQDMPRLVSRDG
jgi:hypothetical protein